MAKVKPLPEFNALEHRTWAVSLWLDRSPVRASGNVRIMIGETSVTVHSAERAQVMLRCEWDDKSIIVAAGEPVRHYLFVDLDVSLRFVDAVLQGILLPDEPPSTIPLSLADDAFWNSSLNREVASLEEQPKQMAQVAKTPKSAAVRAVPMDIAAMGSWTSAWTL